MLIKAVFKCLLNCNPGQEWDNHLEAQGGRLLGPGTGLLCHGPRRSRVRGEREERPDQLGVLLPARVAPDSDPRRRHLGQDAGEEEKRH